MSIPVKVVVPIVMSIVSSTWYLANAQAKDRETVRQSIDALIVRVSTIEGQRYSKPEAVEQAMRMAIENPGMRVPDPRNPSQIIIVQATTRIDNSPNAARPVETLKP